MKGGKWKERARDSHKERGWGSDERERERERNYCRGQCEKQMTEKNERKTE